MSHLSSVYRLKHLLVISICATSVFMNACSELGAKPETLTNAQACKNLKNLIADHPNQFENTKTKFSTNKRLNVWVAEKVYPSAENCQVWEWGTGLFNYTCSWNAADENQAIENFQEGEAIIKACLGNEWVAQASDTPNGGKRTTYSSPVQNTIVSIRYFKEQKGWSPSWKNVVLVGDKNNLDAQIQ